jgi:hypothetical protein
MSTGAGNATLSGPPYLRFDGREMFDFVEGFWEPPTDAEMLVYGLEQCYPCGIAKEGKDRWYYTSPVGSFASNKFGLYDMSGNVWQWTEDCMTFNGYVDAPTDGSSSMSGDCRDRVLRGGSWLDPAKYLLCATVGRQTTATTPMAFGLPDRCTK